MFSVADWNVMEQYLADKIVRTSFVRIVDVQLFICEMGKSGSSLDFKFLKCKTAFQPFY